MSLTFCPAGKQTIIAYEVFVLGRDVLRQLGDKIVRFEELDVLFPVCIVFRLVNDCTV